MALQIKSEYPEGKRGIKKFHGSLRNLASVLGHVQLLRTPWTVACQSPLSMEFSRQEYWSGLPSYSRGSSNSGIKPSSRMPPALAGGFFTTSATWKAHKSMLISIYNLRISGPSLILMLY